MQPAEPCSRCARCPLRVSLPDARCTAPRPPALQPTASLTKRSSGATLPPWQSAPPTGTARPTRTNTFPSRWAPRFGGGSAWRGRRVNVRAWCEPGMGCARGTCGTATSSHGAPPRTGGAAVGLRGRVCGAAACRRWWPHNIGAWNWGREHGPLPLTSLPQSLSRPAHCSVCAFKVLPPHPRRHGVLPTNITTGDLLRAPEDIRAERRSIKGGWNKIEEIEEKANDKTLAGWNMGWGGEPCRRITKPLKLVRQR